MSTSTVTLIVVAALLSGLIVFQQRRITDLTDALVDAAERREQAAANAVNAYMRQSPETVAKTLEAVSHAVEQQVAAMSEAVKVAWAPSPPPLTPLQGRVEQIMEKYNMPVIQDIIDHDMGKDPTDEYLFDGPIAHRSDTAMIDGSSEDSNPTGIPGFEPAWD